jgi:hypothetical protein
MSDKINILFLSASPRDAGGRLRGDIELRQVDKAIRSALSRDSFSIASCFAAERNELQDALLRHRPQIVHFSGHSDSKDGLLFEDARECEAPVSGAALAALFAALGGTIRIVFLNSCHSRAAAEAFHHLIDYTIAMRGVISDAAATVFASAFYRALAYRKAPDVAFRLAVNALEMEQIPETHVPELLVRPGLLLSPPAAAVPEADGNDRDRVRVDAKRDAWVVIGNGTHITHSGGN